MTATRRPVDEAAPGSEIGDELQDLLALAPQVTHALGRRLGVVDTDVEAMQHLAGAPLHPAEIARRLGVTSAGATVVVDRLVGNGHARRAPDPDDGRRVIVEATPTGIGDVVGALMPMLERLTAIEEGFSPAERAAIRRYLREAADAMRLLTEPQ